MLMHDVHITPRAISATEATGNAIMHDLRFLISFDACLFLYL